MPWPRRTATPAELLPPHAHLPVPAEVLGELGFSPAGIMELEAVGALVQPAAAPAPRPPHDGHG